MRSHAVIPGVNKNAVVSGALALWLISTFVVAILPRSIAFNLTYGVLSLILLLLVFRSYPRKSRGATLTLCLLYFLSTAIPLCLSIAGGRISVLYYWVLGLNTLLAVKCLEKISLPHQVIIARLLIVACFVAGGVVASGDRADIDAAGVLGGSSNLLSAALIAVVCWYCFVRFHAGCKAPIMVPLALLVFAIFLGGRSGIIISFGIFLIGILFRAIRSKLSLIAFLLILLPLVWFFLSDLLMDVIAGTRLRFGFQDDVRPEMINEYIRSLGPLSLLIGSEFDPSGIIASYGGNPHNSIIRAHSMFGIFPMALFGLMVTISALKVLSSPSRVSVYGIALGGLILLRSWYDSTTFWFELDFAVVILLCSPIIFSERMCREITVGRKRRANLGMATKDKYLDILRASS